jgi:protein-tyrosine-phosphatase/DNA-binding transcriptional ArsR family regulator
MQVDHNSAPPKFLKLLAHDVRWQILTSLAHSDLRVQELAALTGKPINLISYHLKQLRGQAVVREQRSSADGRDVYYSLDLARLGELHGLVGAQLHPALDLKVITQREMKFAPHRVLFLCTHNRARSQMAEGLLRHLSQGQVEVHSAGSAPGEVHPLAVHALAQRGVNIREQHSKHLDVYKNQSFDYVITVCDRMREQCPVFSGAPDCIHWSIADPIAALSAATTTAERGAIFAATAQELERRICGFLPMLAIL